MGPDWCLACPWRAALTRLRHWWHDRHTTNPDWTPLDEAT